MPVVELEGEAARRELEEVLKSPGFARNERLSHFLRFLVERHLEGRDQELKESVIGSEVFGRKPDYSPKRDPIVRTEARRLRDRLSQYYEGVGANDTARIELPKGGYVPVVRGTEGQPATSAPRPEGGVPSRLGKWRLVSLAGAGLTLVLAIIGMTRFAPGGRLRPETSSAAYDLYLRARAFEVLPSLSGIESSIDLFHQAITKDPSFAPAYAGVAAGYAARSGFDGFDAAGRADMIARGWAAAGKAAQLDPRSADAYYALGMMQARQAQWEPAERSFRRAIEIAPRDLLWRDHFAMFLLLPLGRMEEAIRQLRIAEEIGPLSPQTHSALNTALRSAGRFDEAHSHCQKAAANDQQRSVCWAQVLMRQGENEEAVRILEAVWSSHLMEPGAQALGVAYAKAGRLEDAERIAAMLPRLASKTQIFGALGDKDRTFEALDRMVPMGPARIGRDFLISPNFAFLRGDPRLKALRKKVGLPE
jgi:tetratricopeptide (TPR) repeat protein